MWRRFTRLLVLTLAGSLASVSLSQAQITTGTLRGVVADASGAVLPGATVELSGESQIGGTQAVITDQSGQFRFTRLAPGAYTLKASLSGFKTVIRQGLRVEVGRTFDVDFSLEVGGVAETVTVSGESPLVDTTKTAVTVNYNQEFVKNTPVSRFSVFDLFQMTPGISPSQVQDSNQSSAFGSNTNENQYQIDGTDITAPTNGQMWPFPNTDIVEELELVGVGAPAEYGNMQGAVFNVVTKSGGNDVSGLGNWFSQYQALTGNNQADEEFPYHREKYQDATIQVGGPFLRDRLWWFGSYQYQRDFFSEPGTDPRFPTEASQDRVFAKVSWQVSPKNRVMFAYHNDHWRLPSTITPTTPREASTLGRGHNPTPTATWHMLVNDRTTFELRYGGFYNWSSTQGLLRDLTIPGVNDLVTGVSSVNTRTSSWSNYSPRQTSVAAKLSRFARFGGHDHDLRFGVQFRNGGSQSESVWPGGRQIFLSNGQPTHADVRDPSISGGSVRTYSAYVDDGWALTGRIKLNLGVRFDLNQGWIQDMPQLDVTRNEIGTVPGIDDLIEWKAVSPRAGVNIQLRRGGGSILRASYGRYYQAVTTNLFSELSPAQAVTRRLGWNPATGQYDILLRVTDPRGQFTVDPGLNQPFTDQYTIGVDHELLPNLAIGGSYIRKRGDNFLGRVDVASTFAPRPFTDPETGSQLTVLNRISAPQDVRVVLTNPGPGTCPYCPEEFWQRYNGVLLTVTKRMSQRWQAIASVTLSKTEGLHSGSGGQTSGSQTSAPGTFGDDPNEFINAAGLLSGDRNVLWKLQGSYVLPYEIVVSSNWQWVAGRPYTRRFSVTGLSQGNVTIFLQPRDGSLRTPAQNYIDLRAEKRIALGGRRKLTLMGDVFNVLNMDEPRTLISEVIGSVSGGRFVPSANFGRADTIVNPRRAMLGVRFEF